MVGLNFTVLDRIHQHREIQDPKGFLLGHFFPLPH